MDRCYVVCFERFDRAAELSENEAPIIVLLRKPPTCEVLWQHILKCYGFTEEDSDSEMYQELQRAANRLPHETALQDTLEKGFDDCDGDPSVLTDFHTWVPLTHDALSIIEISVGEGDEPDQVDTPILIGIRISLQLCAIH